MRRAVAYRRRGAWSADEARASVTLAYLDRHRRRIRLIDDAGEAFMLDLPETAHLNDGDGLLLEGGGYILVRAAPEPLIEVACADVAALARVAWHLGNRHLPVQIVGDRLRLRDDHVILHMIEGLGATAIRLKAPFDPEGGAYGDHGHAH
jgi:urease accessory protein